MLQGFGGLGFFFVYFQLRMDFLKQEKKEHHPKSCNKLNSKNRRNGKKKLRKFQKAMCSGAKVWTGCQYDSKLTSGY